MRIHSRDITRCCFTCALPLALVLALFAGQGFAQSSTGPSYVAPRPAVAAPVDRPFAGLMRVDVDATDVARRIFRVHQQVPVGASAGGAVTLLYPRWEAASHGPSLTVTDLAGLEISAAGRRLPWRRDAYEPHAFHVQVPAGTQQLEVRFQMVAGGELLTRDIVSVPWQRLLLYPAGWYARNIPVSAGLTLPNGLRPFSALDVERARGTHYDFKTTSLETLLDTPVLAGRHAAQVPLGGAVSLDIVALRPEDLQVPPARVAELRALLAQLRAVFGPPPFARYAILARLSDEGASGGTEHRTSSENGLASSHFREWPDQILSRDLIAHEIVHAWNGFYRTPADLWAPTPNVPVSGSLLWMYEGQTEFWGRVLATRAGQFTPDEVRDRLALEAAEVAMRPGRAWRSLSDDVHYPAFMLRQPVAWRDWQRRRDYYSEGVMLWLAVDAELRARSGGERGIDDFAQRFFAGATPDAPTRTYTFDDICATLNAVAPADWAGFLRGWIDAHDELDTTRGLTQHGWALVYTDTPTAAFRASEEEAGVSDLSHSLGLAVRADGLVRTVVWNGPAFAAGLRPGTRVLTVNGAPFDQDALRDAVRGSTRRPIVLGIAQDAHRADVHIQYAGPLRYPRLERLADRPDTLARLLAPR
ncbi:M61 family metallopeptidase [Xanthomonas melonis]|uniref:M61 family metallopeptidase n=1 Tax=Xanthomonas melonis TaxID=56456 RepID=A0ABS8NTF4_9XANT|nr:M61 family peptidase [Xanthomonas melonis]MCD0258137.1 M61 family metallopeptidase [Xanthomonas melonis]MCD0266357.1 M61 family metallopeptidase [Xanthomonas melonis]